MNSFIQRASSVTAAPMLTKQGFEDLVEKVLDVNVTRVSGGPNFFEGVLPKQFRVDEYILSFMDYFKAGGRKVSFRATELGAGWITTGSLAPSKVFVGIGKGGLIQVKMSKT